MLNRTIVISLFTCLTLVFSSNAQTVLKDRSSFDDPRLQRVKETFRETYGGVLPLTFSVTTMRVHSNQFESARSVLSNFVYKIGGKTVQKREANFQISLVRTESRGDLNNWEDLYNLEIMEVRNRKMVGLGSYAGIVSCTRNDLQIYIPTGLIQASRYNYEIDGKTADVGCSLTSDIIEEMVLRASFSGT